MAEFAKNLSAPGALARLLLELEQEGVSADVDELVRRARRALQQVEQHGHFTLLKEREVTDKLARDYLRTQARALLTQLVTQTT